VSKESNAQREIDTALKQKRGPDPTSAKVKWEGNKGKK